MYVRIDSMNIWKTRKLQYQNIWTNDLEDGMTTLVMTLDLEEHLTSQHHGMDLKIAKLVAYLNKKVESLEQK